VVFDKIFRFEGSIAQRNFVCSLLVCREVHSFFLESSVYLRFASNIYPQKLLPACKEQKRAYDSQSLLKEKVADKDKLLHQSLSRCL